MNSFLDQLHPYPFEKLSQLKSCVEAPTNKKHIALSIGEPKHAPPEFVLNTLQKNLPKVSAYPTTKGLPELREAICSWANIRFKLSANSQHQGLDPETNVLPVNGTREALFAFAQATIDTTQKSPKILMPNPFYQIYEGAAILAGASPVFINCTEKNGFLPCFDDVSEQTWRDCQLLYICTPGNPSGAVINIARLTQLIELADKYDFIIASDECYSELYIDEENPPPGILQACANIGRNTYKRCVAFHSLSKRSNLPGLRSGFVAGDAEIIAQFLRYRTYHGSAMPVHSQLASVAAWQDEDHVLKNRELYREKFSAVTAILNETMVVSAPAASFYLWPHTPINDTEFAQGLFKSQNVTVLPGQYLARNTPEGNPGENRIRMALVAPKAECIEAAERINCYIRSLTN